MSLMKNKSHRAVGTHDTIGRNVRIDYRWDAANADVARKYATELIALSPSRTDSYHLCATARVTSTGKHMRHDGSLSLVPLANFVCWWGRSTAGPSH
jgi:hypothetical protein